MPMPSFAAIRQCLAPKSPKKREKHVHQNFELQFLEVLGHHKKIKIPPLNSPSKTKSDKTPILFEKTNFKI